jgi:uncharacterized protein (TIGR01244 family)
MKFAITPLLSIPLIFLGLAECYQLTTENTTITSSVAHLMFSNNLHEVMPAKLYRSGQMPVKTLLEETTRLGVKTVLDLRMEPDPVAKNDVQEEFALKPVGVSYLHFPLLGSREMKSEQVLELLRILNSVEGPLLVHCSSGTHRTGIVSAIYLMDVQGVPYEEAIRQMSAKYGFFKFEREIKSAFSGHPTIDNILWRYGEYLKKDPKIKFRDWVKAELG